MRPEKIQLANDIAGLIVGSEFLFFVSYKGLKTKELEAFRTKLYNAGASCRVLKNRVVHKVAELNGLDALANAKIAGDTAVVLGKGDVGAVAKIIDDFTTSSKGVIAPKCGYFEGVVLTETEVKAFAAMPSKDQLRAQLLGLLVAVPTGLVSVLNAKVSSIVNVINAYKKKLDEQAN